MRISSLNSAYWLRSECSYEKAKSVYLLREDLSDEKSALVLCKPQKLHAS